MRILVALAGILFASGAMASPATADLVLNGGFETGDFTDWNYTSVDRLSFVGTGFAHSGNYAAFLGDTQEDGGGSISQSLATTIGQQYTLNFWFAGDGDNPSGFTALVGGNVLFNIINPAFDLNYNLYTFNFTATSGSTLLEFKFYDDPFYINLDDVSVVPTAAVPEPSTMVLAASGMGMFACYTFWRRRRSQ